MQAVLGAEDPVVLALAVADVADQRTRQVLAVPTDLMEPPGARPGLDQGVAPEGLAAAQLGDRVDPRAAVVVGDRVVDHQLGRRVAAGDREVALVDGAGRERVAGGARGLGVEREQHRARRAAIEAVDQVHVRAELIAHPLEQRHVVVAAGGPAAVDRDPGGLVDDDEARVAARRWSAARRPRQRATGRPRWARKNSICRVISAASDAGSAIMCVPASATKSNGLPALNSASVSASELTA
jgi:hypothetical protein